MRSMVALLVLLLSAAAADESGQGYTIVPNNAPSFTPEELQDFLGNWSTSISSTPAQTQPPALFQGNVDSHNRYRAMHGAGPLVWDDSLAQSAARVANKCNFSHDPDLGVGENLAAMIGMGIDPANAVQQAIVNWYDEISEYDFNNPGFNFMAGHFTQVVWVDSTNIGCATNFCNGNFWVDPNLVSGNIPKTAQMTVCHYMPPGNSGGAADFRANVLRKTATPPPPASPRPPAPTPSPTPNPNPNPSPSPNPNPPGGNGLVGSTMEEGSSITSGTCMLADNGACRLCINNFGEITALNNRTSTTVRWRSAVQLGQRGTNNVAPYKLALNNDHTVTVTNGAGTVMMMLRIPGDPAARITLKMRNDCKAAVLDEAGRCVVAWGYGRGQPAGC